MKALIAKLRLNSLYSIRIPFTWQSALTYPVLPPSTVIGLVANALQRFKNNRHPLDCLDEVENKILWAGSRLLSPCIAKSYTMSAIVKWEDEIGGKFTNALGRQFSYTKELEIMAIFKDNTLIEDIVSALKTSPVTCGDSESSAIVEEIATKDVEENVSENEVETSYPFPFTAEVNILRGKGQVFLMHERCKKEGKDFPLIAYIVPVLEKQGILYPNPIKIKVSEEKVLKVQDSGFIILKTHTPKPETKKRRLKRNIP